MPAEISQASFFYDEIVAKGAEAYDYLAALAEAASKTEENEWREFKGAGFIDAPIPLQQQWRERQRSEILK